MKQMIYLFIARDTDMFVLETHIEKKVQMAKFQAEIFEVLQYYSAITDPTERPTTDIKELVFDNLRLHMAFDVIYYGLITQSSFAEDKAQRVLADVKEEVRKMYKGNVSYMFKQSNLERNCLDKFLKPKIAKILDNYSTNISSKNLNKAFEKVDEVK